MKKFGLIGLLLAAAMGVAVVAEARVGNLPRDTQYTFQVHVATSDTDSAGDMGPGTVIYGFRLIANDAGDGCGLYDSADPGAGLTGTVIDELYEATDNDAVDSDWPGPYVLTTDLSIVTNGICIVYYAKP